MPANSNMISGLTSSLRAQLTGMEFARVRQQPALPHLRQQPALPPLQQQAALPPHRQLGRGSAILAAPRGWLAPRQPETAPGRPAHSVHQFKGCCACCVLHAREPVRTCKAGPTEYMRSASRTSPVWNLGGAQGNGGGSVFLCMAAGPSLAGVLQQGSGATVLSQPGQHEYRATVQHNTCGPSECTVF